MDKLDNKLKALKSTKGQPANDKESYFSRDKIVKNILRVINNGENILISAPRRIGKSTILKHIKDNPQQNQIIKYIAIQSVDTSEEFFKQIFNELINDKEIFDGINGYFKKISVTTRAYISRVSPFDIKGIKISQKENIDYYKECKELIKNFKINKKIIFFIDEFPDALNNILKKDKELAIKFLQQNRDLRINFSDTNLQFVYTGSTGLTNVVKQTNKLDLINDIVNIKIPPLEHDEAKELIQRLILGFQKYERDFDINDKEIDFILKKITWKIPYYMQIIISELFDYYEESKNKINKKSIKFVFKEIIKSNSKHCDYFENWKSRLKGVFKQNDYAFAIEVLSYIAKKDSIEYAVFCDLGVKNKVKESKYILDVLQHDGYISEDKKEYGFNSFLLKQWWYSNVAI